jgi:hypothetical protein
MPLALNLVPARRHDSLETIVRLEGIPEPFLSGADEYGTVTV